MNTETKIAIKTLQDTGMTFANRKLMTNVMVATRGYVTRDGVPMPVVSVHVSAGTFKITLGHSDAQKEGVGE
jgi:hypothetical protein